MRKVTTIIGNSNGSQITNGSTTKAVSVTHQQGNDLVITGFQICYGTGQEKCFARLYDAQNNRDITSPTTPINTIGVAKDDSPPVAPWIKIEPMIIKSGQSIDLYITNATGNTIAVNDISLTLYGYQNI